MEDSSKFIKEWKPNPTLNDFVNNNKYTVVFDAPGKTQTHRVKMTLLTQGEYNQILKQSGQLFNPLDSETRGAYLKVEQLVQAIDSIDDQEFIHKDESIKAFLKGQLRRLLENNVSINIDFLYQCFTLLQAKQRAKAEKSMLELKKKFEDEVLSNLQML